ncbi:Sialic acid-binding Ig-like lectin 15 [Pteropus alecto]|uniref:Sialic acid-binding Ig-like lectin 15 n=1 Tax=Pteropus alecto TaxID=9402 RepID=L5K238_PTEAL|nr:Sialic acid-binding Ig-like lectin 15 [Pteropus alecto]
MRVCCLKLEQHAGEKGPENLYDTNPDVAFFLGVPSQHWSMQVPAEVSAMAGEAAILPCTFTHPHRHYDGPLTAIWRSGEPYAGPQVFRPQAQESNYENLSQMSPQGPPAAACSLRGAAQPPAPTCASQGAKADVQLG